MNALKYSRLSPLADDFQYGSTGTGDFNLCANGAILATYFPGGIVYAYLAHAIDDLFIKSKDPANVLLATPVKVGLVSI